VYVLAVDNVEVENCLDEVDKDTEDDPVSVNESVLSTDCYTANPVAINDPELSKYWWQRYRLFSRFDQGIMIDRGW